MTSYAYAIVDKLHKKLVGGTMHAESMDDALRAIVRCNKVTVRHLQTVIRPCDNAVIKCCEWIRNGEKVSIYVYASPEAFLTEFGEKK